MNVIKCMADEIELRKKQYVEMIRVCINNGNITNYRKEQSLLDICNQLPPVFTLYNVKTWICKGGDGYQIIWATADNWNVGWASESEIRFNDFPDITTN